MCTLTRLTKDDCLSLGCHTYFLFYIREASIAHPHYQTYHRWHVAQGASKAILVIIIVITIIVSSDIWEKFVEFESTVGDLSSIVNVEKRRAAVIKTEV